MNSRVNSLERTSPGTAAAAVANLVRRIPGYKFLMQFVMTRGLVSVCAFAGQMVVAVRLGQKDFIAYVAACAVVLLSTEAQTLVGNLEVLAKRHNGANLSAILSNRLCFNLCIAAPAIWFSRSLWAGQLGWFGAACAVVAVTMSAFFPGSYGDGDSLRLGLRAEAGAAALFLTGRLACPPTLQVMWGVFCAEILARALVGLTLASKKRHLSAAFDWSCARHAFQYGIVLLFQMAFQRLEIAILPGIALAKPLVAVWALGTSVLFALNAVVYQALVGYRVVEDPAARARQQRFAWSLIAGLLALAVTLLSVILAGRKSAIDYHMAPTLLLLLGYFFVVTLENFSYMNFFFAVPAKRMLVLSACRVVIVLAFAGMVAAGVSGFLCLCYLLLGKVAAALGEMIYARSFGAPEFGRAQSAEQWQRHHSLQLGPKEG